MQGRCLQPTLAAPASTAAGAVLLIACYELGRQPLSLAWPLAYLERAGVQATVIDSAVEPLTDTALRGARLIAIATPMHTALRLAVPILERARQLNPTAHRLAFGLYAVLNADYLLRSGLVDSVLGGEVEQDLLDLVEQVIGAGPGSPPAALLATEVVGDRAAVPALRRLELGVPQRAALPPATRYARLLWRGEEVLAGSAESTRGCRHTCRHCPLTPVYRGRFFAVPVPVVIADVRQQVEQGISHISFGDPDFLNGPTHALRVARALHAAFPGVTFDATVKIEHIIRHRAAVSELARLGCLFIVSAVESRSDEVLRRLDKGHTRADIDAALAILDGAGIALRPSLLAFTPWTTPDDYLELLDWVLAEGLDEHVDPVHFAIRLLVPPGSALLDDPDTARFFGELDAANFTHVWRHPDPRMDELHRTVLALVEAATRRRRPAAETLVTLRTVAAALVAHPAPAPAARVLRPLPPRLTETWFC
ncbi:MAG: radical SAM protein [Chloroflexi bacterium]|nr:radical SAM protein [Chloroflexota bacterium]